MSYYVYIVTNRRNGTLYTGVTNDIARRMYEHKCGGVPGFTQKYGLKILVYYESFDQIEPAIQREKTIKRYYRQWKINLVEGVNPDWRDLTQDLNR